MSSIHLARKATVALRRMRGTYPLVNFLRERSYGYGVVEVSDYDDDLDMALDLNDHMASQIFWFGYYSRDVVQCLKTWLKPGDAFIDGGANIGEITLVAAKATGPTGRVVSFEPIDAIRDKLVQNIAVNHLQDRIVVRDQGLSDAPRTLPIYGKVEKYRDGSLHSGLGTLFATEDRPEIIANIELATIDAVVAEQGLDRLAGIKLDIEGAELAAIRGAAETLERLRPWLIVEIGSNTCEAAGYAPGDIFDALPAYRFGRIERGGRLVPIGKADLLNWQNVMCVPE